MRLFINASPKQNDKLRHCCRGYNLIVLDLAHRHQHSLYLGWIFRLPQINCFTKIFLRIFTPIKGKNTFFDIKIVFAHNHT